LIRGRGKWIYKRDFVPLILPINILGGFASLESSSSTSLLLYLSPCSGLINVRVFKRG